MKSIITYIVDSFTNQPFKGNPAGVCIIDQVLTDHQMLNIAKELGLSETAFINTIFDNAFSIRYFSPKMEIPLCGHATLASAKVLFSRLNTIDHLSFKTIEDITLKIRKINDQIQMTFPVYETRPMNAPLELLNALGIKQVTNSEFNTETNILLLEINDCNVLRNLKPDFEALYNSHQDINGVLVTSLSTKEHVDFESRYFWPWSGTNEDPVTGGTHTFLTKYWSKKLNKTKMNSFQCSERTGFMTVELIENNKMTITSEAQIILEGNMFLKL